MTWRPEHDRIEQAELRALQSDRLASLLERLRSAETPYWRSKLEGVPLVTSIEDMDTLPFTEKAELRETYPYGMLAVPRGELVRIHASSGTRGKPTVVGYTAGDVAVFAEVNARALACAGASSEDVVHVAYGYGLFTGGLGLHYGVERLGATAVPASGGNPGFQLQLLADLGATGLACTPSFALLLAERAAESGMRESIGLRWGILGAEPWSEGLRRRIEEAWGPGFDACDIYGLSEVIGPGVAAECREGKGAMHVFEDHFAAEIVDPETGKAVGEGEQGELVLTTLSKEAQPVLRYRTGDVTRFVPGPCPCGRMWRRIERISGRVDDMLIIRGINVFPKEIETALLDDPRLGGQYAIVVDRRGTLPELDVHVELAEAADDTRVRAVAAELQQTLLQRVRIRVNVDVRQPGEMPRQEVGKARRVFDRTGEEDPLA